MFRTLRSRLIVSHVSVLLILLPLLGVALTFLLESRVVLVNFGDQLTGQAVLVGELLKEDTRRFRDPRAAADFVEQIAPLFPGELSLFDAQGRLLATSDVDNDEAGDFPDIAGLDDAMQGRQFSRVRFSRDARTEVVDVVVPAFDDAGDVIALVRITDYVSTLQERFERVRVLILGALAAALLLGTLLGYFLAVTVEEPLARLTQSVESFPQQPTPVLPAERGPEEVQVLARAFRQMLRRIADLEDNRRYLLSNVVHELGRPLGALCAAGRAMLDGAVSEPGLREDLLKGIDGEIARLEVLLDDLSRLREYPYPPGAAAPLRLEPVALGEWLKELLSPWREAVRAAGLGWRAEIPAVLPVVTVDPQRLGQAFGNLLSNAVKYTPRPGEVTVRVNLAEGHWQFQVADTGPGVPDDERERIFEPFYRTPPERHYPQGLGLGLTISRDLVRAHGGDLALESCPAGGVCFIARLPLASR